MSWLNHQLRSSLLALLGTSSIGTKQRDNQVEYIRNLMLHELGDAGNQHFSRVVRHVRYAIDAHALWFLRSELMEALSAMHGETIAREKINHISQKFDGLLPKGLNSRSRPNVGSHSQPP